MYMLGRHVPQLSPHARHAMHAAHELYVYTGSPQKLNRHGGGNGGGKQRAEDRGRGDRWGCRKETKRDNVLKPLQEVSKRGMAGGDGGGKQWQHLKDNRGRVIGGVPEGKRVGVR